MFSIFTSMYKRLTEELAYNLQERYFEDPLFCSFSGILDRISVAYDDLTAVECWTVALEMKDRIAHSRRPDLTVPGIKRLLKTRFGSFADESGSNIVIRHDEDTERSAFLVLMCITYMICSTDIIDGIRRKVVQNLLKTVCPNPLFLLVYQEQREAEQIEENNGNPVPTQLDAGFAGDRLCDREPTPYGRQVSILLPDNLRSCLADESLFAKFCSIINGPVMSFINSPEGNAQYWEIVKRVAVEEGYISRKCSRLRFAEVICAVCPSAGKASTLAASMEKYPLNDKESENDMRTIRSRFEL